MVQLPNATVSEVVVGKTLEVSSQVNVVARVYKTKLMSWIGEVDGLDFVLDQRDRFLLRFV